MKTSAAALGSFAMSFLASAEFPAVKLTLISGFSFSKSATTFLKTPIYSVSTHNFTSPAALFAEPLSFSAFVFSAPPQAVSKTAEALKRIPPIKIFFQFAFIFEPSKNYFLQVLLCNRLRK